jgi:Uma2 family endonuclease
VSNALSPHAPLGPPDPSRVDHRVVLRGVSWQQYEELLRIRGDEAGTRMTFLKGELEIMSPSRDHELIKKMWARLLEAYAEESGIELVGHGSWTVRSVAVERGLEPDECYVVGVRDVVAPDLALEVIWTSGLLDKMEVSRGLGVREVWVWRDDRIEVCVLRDGAYERAASSELLPGIDLARVATLLRRSDQTAAVREYRAHLRSLISSSS